MKPTILVACVLVAIAACLVTATFAASNIRATVQDALQDSDSDSGQATATSGQRATAVCVALLNWKACTIEQDSVAETAQPAPRLEDVLQEGTLGFITFGMVFMLVALIALPLARFVIGKPGQDW
jgi:hypothetical protein